LENTERLTFFGLTKQEATVYLMLLAGQPQTGYEVAKATGISRSNAYTALAGLVDKGAACLIEGAATRYSPLPPEEFCDNRIRRLAALKAELLSDLPEKTPEADGYITVKGRTQILDKMRNMLLHARLRVYLSASSETAGLLRGELEGCLRRGLKLVLITEEPFALEGAVLYPAGRTGPQIRLITDSVSVLTGDLSGGEEATCLYSRKANLVDLIKESLKNEIKLTQLTKGNR
jgi:sugar-specific transcriptional regulator TrmB